jgi:hypothetical protein
MFTRISSLTLAILLFLVMLGNVPSPSFFTHSPYLYVASVVLLIFASLGINFKRLNFTWPHLFLPVIYLAAASGVFAILTSPTPRILFLIFACVVFYLLEIKLGRESHFLQNVYLLSVFALYLTLMAMQFYFNLRIWVIVPAVFALTYILAIQGFAGFSLPAKKYFYLLVSMLCAEAVWGLSFWPVHFFVSAVVLFCFFYILWLFSFSAFFGKLSRQKIYLQLSLIAIVLILTLSTAAWRPLK